MIRARRACRLLTLTLLLASPATNAALPAEVDGQPLPTLAPMLVRVTPAVVNIATRGRVQAREIFLARQYGRAIIGDG